MGLEIKFMEGETPLDPDEMAGLLLKTITTRQELDEFEQLNIEDALQWVLRKRLKQSTILSIEFITLLHKKMFNRVWKWAGKFRNSEKNFGVHVWEISMSLKNLIEDTEYWIENKTFEPDEIAVRFKHRLVSIHCFANGNGRHSRLMADVIIEKIFGKNPFTWGGYDLSRQRENRTKYLEVVREADSKNFEPLLKFSRQS